MIRDKIGVFGGSFDPIHFGHLLLAEEACQDLGLSKVLFMPTYMQPFKQVHDVSDTTHRLNMIKIAISDNKRFEYTDIEIINPVVSYTINSLNVIKKQFPNTEIFFIMGTDTFLQISKWYKSDELLSNFSIVVGVRPGYKNQEVMGKIDQLKSTYGTNIQVLSNIEIEISSTNIKNRVNSGKSIKYLVPNSVETYVKEHGLYI